MRNLEIYWKFIGNVIDMSKLSMKSMKCLFQGRLLPLNTNVCTRQDTEHNECIGLYTDLIGWHCFGAES